MELTSQHVSRIIEILGSIALVGLGALLTPWISSVIENRKIKKGIKPALIKALNNLHSFIKIKVTLTNHNDFQRIGSNSLWNKLNNSQTPEKDKPEIARQSQIFIEDIRINYVDINFYSQKLIEADSELLSVLMQIQTYIGKKTFDKVNTLVVEYSSGYNTLPNFVDFTFHSTENAAILGSRLDEFKSNINVDFNNLLFKLNGAL